MAEAQKELEEEEVDGTIIEEEVNEVDDETKAFAKSMGWVEEADFRGNKENWRPADKFVEKGMNDLPVLRERLRSTTRKLSDMENDISEFKVHHEQTQVREYQRAMKDLEEKAEKTVEAGDTDEYKRIQRQKQDLSVAHSQTARPGSRTPNNPLYTAWKDENAEWFEKDSDMTAYANRMSDYVAEMKPELIGKQEFLNEIDKEVKSRFPDRFENPNRDNPNTVETGGRAPKQRGNAKGYANLPAEAKASCDKFVRRGLLTKEQYVKDYEWE